MQSHGDAVTGTSLWADGPPRRTAALSNFSGQSSLDRSGAASGSESSSINLRYYKKGAKVCLRVAARDTTTLA